jgi:hypothetical protein
VQNLSDLAASGVQRGLDRSGASVLPPARRTEAFVAEVDRRFRAGLRPLRRPGRGRQPEQHPGPAHDHGHGRRTLARRAAPDALGRAPRRTSCSSRAPSATRRSGWSMAQRAARHAWRPHLAEAAPLGRSPGGDGLHGHLRRPPARRGSRLARASGVTLALDSEALPAGPRLRCPRRPRPRPAPRADGRRGLRAPVHGENPPPTGPRLPRHRPRAGARAVARRCCVDAQHGGRRRFRPLRVDTARGLAEMSGTTVASDRWCSCWRSPSSRPAPGPISGWIASPAPGWSTRPKTIPASGAGRSAQVAAYAAGRPRLPGRREPRRSPCVDAAASSAGPGTGRDRPPAPAPGRDARSGSSS